MVKNPYEVAVGGLVVAAMAFVGLFAVLPEAARTDLLFEVAKAAISFLPIAFFSVIVADLVRRRDAERARREQRLERQRAFRVQAIGAYNESKAARTILRGAGLRPDSGAALTDEDLATLDQQIRAVIDAQLTMEQLKREVGTPGDPFVDPESLRGPLEVVEKYLKRVTRDWESGRPALHAGADASDLGEWPHYKAFVAAKDAERLADSPTAAFKALEAAIVTELVAGI